MLIVALHIAGEDWTGGISSCGSAAMWLLEFASVGLVSCSKNRCDPVSTGACTEDLGRYWIQGRVLILNGDSETTVSFLPTGRVWEEEEAISKTHPGALELSGCHSSIRLHLEFQNMSSMGKVSVFAGLIVKELLVTIPNLRSPLGLVKVFCKRP